MATRSSILAWTIPQTVEPGELQSITSQRVGHAPAQLNLNDCPSIQQDGKNEVNTKIELNSDSQKLVSRGLFLLLSLRQGWKESDLSKSLTMAMLLAHPSKF